MVRSSAVCSVVWLILALGAPGSRGAACASEEVETRPEEEDLLRQLGPDHAKKMARGLEIFKREVRKILVERCVRCHGGKKTRSRFDLTTRAGLLAGGSEGPGVVVGNHRASFVYQVIAHEEEPYMPHREDKLSDEDIGRIARWIDLGAPYDAPLVKPAADPEPDRALTLTDEDRDGWAFRPLRPVVPPEVADDAWCRTPVDRFILAKLEEKNLRPNGRAEPRKLIRRVYYDLIGLPPEPDEVEAFVRDPSDAAYRKMVNELLRRPGYGERWARHWLDVARFAESHGFEHDYDRKHAYHYRDFVIKALQQDMPFDRFVRWQVAGDELEPDDPLALMATGFLGAGVFPTQITKKEVERTRYDALDDMAATTASAMLGLTLGCARCHDHKYDPIPMIDYYRFVSTFTTTVRSEIDLDLDPEVHRKAKAAFDAEHAPLVEALEQFEREQLPTRLEQWITNRASADVGTTTWTSLDVVEHESQGGATFTKLEDGSLLVGGKNPEQDTYTLVAHTRQKGITAIRLEALAHQSFVKGGPGRASNGNFGLSRLRLTVAPLGGGDPREIKLMNPQATFEQNRKHLSVAASLDEDDGTGWAVDPRFGKDHAAVFETAEDVGFNTGTKLTFTLDFKVNTQHTIGRPRLAITSAARPVHLDGKVTPQRILEIFARLDEIGGSGGRRVSARAALEELTAEERSALSDWYRRHHDARWRKLNAAVESHLARKPKPELTRVMVCTEGLKPMRHHTQGADFFNETYFLVRGDPDQKREVVTQGFLQVLTGGSGSVERWQVPPPEGWRTSYRRTALANWLTDIHGGAGHLLARVIVNRLWQHHIGRGIVASPNNFGTQGERPTHPELLDWLAVELVQSGWRLSRIHKLIMGSSVYLQSARHDVERARVDPLNRFAWRRAVRRLEAETIRDALLAVSGLLDRRMYGPGTLDENQERRSIYFTIKRSRLIPMMQLFDAPEALVSLGARPTTTIAPQALLFMNNPNVRKYARGFAKRLKPSAERSLSDAVKEGYLIAVAREPTAGELEDSVRFVREQIESHQEKGEKEPLELAFTAFCQVLMSLNEFIYVE